MNIGVIDYGMGNLTSVKNSLIKLGYTPILISKKKDFENFSTIILPGVGAFGKAMDHLKQLELIEPIISFANQGKKLIGICLGMQLLFSRSKEFGLHEGLGIISGEVLPFERINGLRVPHMGWNTAESNNSNFDQFSGDYYHVHSFYCIPDNKEQCLFSANYGVNFCAAVKKSTNVFGFQFHPEKSQKLGLKLLDYTIKYNA